MKVCSKCKIQKDENCFWKRNNRKSGVNSECKDCAKIRRTKKYQEFNEEFRLKRKKYYYENQEKLCKAQIDSQKGNQRYRKYQNKYSIEKRKNNDPKFLARSIVSLALRGKMITRPIMCSKCNVDCKPEGHHEDYSKPLDIIWLCTKCHKELHKQCKTALHGVKNGNKDISEEKFQSGESSFG